MRARRPISTLMLLAVAASGLLGAVMPAPNAFAHAAYKDSNPADKATVSEPPTEIWAEFTEPVTPDSRLDVYDPCGQKVDNGDSSATGYRITISMSGDAAGTYTVAFFVVSAVDGHPTRGDFNFTSTGGSSCGGGNDTGGNDTGGDDGRPKDSGSNEEAGGGNGTGDESSRSAGGPGRSRPKREGSPASNRSKDRFPNRASVDRAGQSNQAVAEGSASERHSSRRITDMPVDGLIIALALAALIGAAGGKIYLGIVGGNRN